MGRPPDAIRIRSNVANPSYLSDRGKLCRHRIAQKLQRIVKRMKYEQSPQSVRTVRSSALLILLLTADASGSESESIAAVKQRAVHGAPTPESATDEVFVFARKREENAQRVPVSVSVLSGERLDSLNAFQIQDAIQGIPNASIEVFTPRQSSLAIRGMGKNPANDGLEPSVGVFLDGVYLGRPGMVITDLIDVERIEILRGPQGALFGKNVAAGALNISTRAPDDVATGYVEATLGDASLMQVKAAASGPVGESGLSYRLTAFTTMRDGFTDALLTGRDLGELDKEGVRGQLQWRTASGFRLRVIADYAAQDEDGPGLVLVDPGVELADGAIRPNNFLDRTARAGYTPEFDPFARRTYAEGEQRMTGEQAGVSVQGDWSWANHMFTSISAWRSWNFRPHVDGDLTPLEVQPDIGFALRHRQVSQEFRLTSPAEVRLQYVLGVYLYGQRLRGTFVSQYGVNAADFAVPGLSPKALEDFMVQTIGTPETQSYAAFAHSTWRASPRLNLSAGLRWTTEHKSADITRTSSGGEPLALSDTVARSLREQLGAASSTHVRLSEDFLSGVLSVSYDFGEEVFGYASISRGAKSGGINSAVVPPGIEQALDPEVATNFEVGLKSEWLQGRLRTNAALYWTDLEGYQATVRDPVRAATFIANAGSVRSRGAELEGVLRVTPTLQFTLTAGWNDARFTSFRNATCPPEVVGHSSCDATGLRVPGAPPWTVAAGVGYARPLLNGRVTMYAGGDVVHTAAYRTELSAYSTIDEHTLANVRFGVRSQTGRWNVWLWSKNLFEEKYYTFLSSGGLFNVGAVYGLVGDPRTYGVSLRVAY